MKYLIQSARWHSRRQTLSAMDFWSNNPRNLSKKLVYGLSNSTVSKWCTDFKSAYKWLYVVLKNVQL